MNATQKEITDEEYEDYLNDIYGEVKICGMTFDSGRALKKLDEIAFNCGKNDYESENEIWICEECNKEYNNEEDAENCCKESNEVD